MSQEDVVLPGKVLTIQGDGKHIVTEYDAPSRTIRFSLHEDLVKRLDYMEKMVNKLSAPNRETMR